MAKHNNETHHQESTPCSIAARRLNKRTFLKGIAGLIVAITLGFLGFFQKLGRKGNGNHTVSNAGLAHAGNNVTQQYPLGVGPDGRSRVYLAQGDTPENNMAAILDALGGIEQFIGPEDIIILKPNSQWWAQGMTNTNTMKAFMETVLAIPGFSGEIIIADNHQFAEPNSRGWTTEERNGDFNYNELVAHFQDRGHPNVTKYHWRGAGPNPNPIEGDDQLGSKIVKGPGEGDGYVWSRDIVYTSSLGRRCLLTWPVFTSAYSGVTIDFKNGAWKDGAYIDQPVKFINFSAINHHGPYVGATASIKNYMGIVDMTCGFHGSTPDGYYNTHFIGLRDLRLPLQDKYPWRVRNWINQYNWQYFEHTGGVLGTFMREVRIADLNIITAHWVGWGSRTQKELSGYPRAILASRDPVALDYTACREILLPMTRNNNDYIWHDGLMKLNDPTQKDQPLYRFIEKCHEEGIGNIMPRKIDLVAV
ncbi:DUF362 domain-containing protein [Desulfatitalea alkaliphila]|uniref:DUF362 domain-containing protein n=1 Tax=Desulfatitalea alkaliphila TaxID=2929485 RepID=A0AA41RBH8_9BACT|nr:DUF362 domain-containing protein [Desulfatitalea alkaliphila]MCJ8502103.1 DUF362 domain-containing protein [Desulfatitalea alkaliphila]